MRPHPASYLCMWFAAFTLASASPVEEVVVVPYDESRPLAEQTPRNYYLDSRTFETLWEKAGRPRPNRGPSSEEAGYALVEALHDAQWQEEGLLVKARYRLLVTGSSWARVPFSFPGAVVKTTSVDGVPAAYDNGDLLVKEPGWHQIETDYQVPEAANGREAQWSVPPATAALIHVRGSKQAPVINAGLPVMVDRKGDEFVVTAALGQTAAIHLVLEGPARTPAVERARLAKVESLLTVHPGLRILRSEIGWEFPGSSLRHFAVDFDPAYAPVRLEIPNLETWKFVRGGPSGARLEFGLTAPVTGALAIAMTAESTAGTGEANGLYPRVRPEATRLEETLVLASNGPVEIEPSLAMGGQRVSIPERLRERANGERLVAAFRSSGEDKPVSFGVRQIGGRDSVRANYVYQVEATRLNVFASGELKLTSARRQFQIGLPPGAIVQDCVTGGGVQSWWRSGDVLWLQCATAKAGTEIPFVVSLTVPGPTVMPLPELAWPDEAEVNGEALILTHSAAETQLTFAAADRVRVVPAAGALSAFTVLPPYQKSHAFSYGAPGFGATIATREAVAVFDAGWVLSAVVNETWIQLTYHVEFEVKRSALRQVVVKIAAAVPELRWEGESLRSVRSVVDGGNRIYTLTFQEEVTEFASLIASTELPLVQGGARLPHLDLPQARQQSQFGVLENRTQGGLETNLARAEEVGGETLPYLPRKMNNPKFYRMTGPDWFFGVGLTKLEAVGGMEMVITSSEIVTAIRDNGEEWYHLSYRMRNQSLQFLPVKLSRDLEVIQVRVAAREVQPKRGPEDKKSETLLIPLDPTRSEDLPFLVELIYRRPANSESALGEQFRRSLEAPELDLGGRTESQTFWRLYLPAGYAAHKVAGAVNQIPGTQRELALAEANLDELDRLARSARSGNQPGIAWRNVLGLAGLTRELGRSESNQEWEQRIRTLEEEAKAFRPGSDLSMTVSAPVSEFVSVSGIVFAENNAAVVERNQKLREASRDRMDSIRERMKLNDFVAVGWRVDPAIEEATLAGPVAESFEFSSAQQETAQRLLDSWKSPSRKEQGVAHVSLDPAIAPVQAIAPGPRIESIELPRAVPDPNPEEVRARLSPEIDFPTEGEPLVFHKLKGNARLEIAGDRQAKRDVPAVWGWFLGSLGLIHVLARLTGTRKSIANVAAS